MIFREVLRVKGEKLELVRGGGNVFRNLGRENGDVDQLKALLAAEIRKALDRDEPTFAPLTPGLNPFGRRQGLRYLVLPRFPG